MLDRKLMLDIIARYEATYLAVNRQINSLFREAMPEGLTVEQYSVLRYLRTQGKTNSSELADTFCVGRSSITALTTRLFDKQLIERQQDPKDRRVTYLKLLPAGEQLTDQSELKIQEMLAMHIQHFDEQEALQFITTYEKLANVMSGTYGIEGGETEQ
ncbi:MarR family transcriptional regulator [Paenibacillus sp. BIHB 4019]|uniref:MarR family transcriptional regulator n=1 Tax=Paenibacillus sp. BIHB 4019 TaxID=1870819 RepID=A0A1B2DGF2_9BACL|nr:MarR family transcriptional regulator [Paenibacillus sp. BIHB 4019]ANY66807.1 MarR family transcriptional regulator [Paenibacillus sp. BIHB 4019]